MNSKRALFAALLTAVGALLLAGLAAAVSSSPTVSIASPASGSNISAKKNPTLALTGQVAFAATTAGTTTLYLRRDGCGTAADNPHLSLVAGNPDGGDGCGLIVDQVGLVGDVAPNAAFTDYPDTDAMPLTFDGSQPTTGQISLSGAQVGLAEVDVDMQALVNGQAVDLGSTTASALLDPTGSATPVPFSIPANPAYDGADVQAFDLRVTVHGPNVYSGFTALSGTSFVNLPSYGASLKKGVVVSLDDPTFASPLQAAINGSGWSLAVATPAAGKHTIYVQATQGYSSSAVASSTFTVKK